MCDTIVALPSATKDGRMLFAKNSDRSPNEPHVVVRYPAKDYDLDKNPNVKLTYITIPQVQHTYEVVLMKPSWIWGAEMGFNEYGLNIGNEAVFTKEKKGKDSLIGMDMLRLALERTKKAKEALDLIIELLQEYGQGGNCGYDHNFHYHNSFLIADREEAYVLETAGKYYAAKKVKDFYAISNCLSIEEDYDIIHPNAIDNVIKKRRCNTMEEFGFARCYSDKIYTHFAKAKKRRCLAQEVLEKNKGQITVQTMMEILRSHAPNYKEDTNSVASICMHAGGLIGDHTTGSYVASLSPDDAYYYATATSTPCQSIFKPLILDKEMPIETENEEKAKEYWMKYERLNRYIYAGQIDKAVFLKEISQLEKEYVDKFESKKTKAERNKIIKECWAKADKLIDEYLKKMNGAEFNFQKGKPSYRKYWKKKTDILFAQKD